MKTSSCRKDVRAPGGFLELPFSIIFANVHYKVDLKRNDNNISVSYLF
ncbi:MAG: hypothetical protein Q4C95_05800 [Planctomycetia bacterium]|nr:hypothetical protein [Planctomycetia bacterium]